MFCQKKTIYRPSFWLCGMKREGFGIFLVLVLVLTPIVLAADIDPNIPVLGDGEEISIIVKLKDTSHEQMQLQSSEFEEQLEQRKDRVEELQTEVLERLESPSNESQPMLELERRFSVVNGFTANVTEEGLEALKNDPDVDKIYLNNIKTLALDTSIGTIEARNVWRQQLNNNITGKGVTVCVIDSGIDYTHPNLGSCSSSDFIGGNCRKVLGGYDYVNNDNNPLDDHGHGTHVAGIVASNDTTYRGVAPDANLVALKACGSSGTCSDANIVSSIDWCMANAAAYNISVISMSLGGGSYTAPCDGEDDVVDESNLAAAAGFFVSVAAGNAGTTDSISSPACGSNVTAVGGVNAGNGLVYNRAPFMWIVAPATNIVSTVLRSGGIISDPSGFGDSSGTSMATPHVAGAAALLIQLGREQNNTNLTRFQIYSALNDTGTVVSESSHNYKLTNLRKAINVFDTVVPTFTFAAPTPSNNSHTTNLSVLINITLSEAPDNILLEWNGTNVTMNRSSAVAWYSNRTFVSNDTYTYKVWANDTAGNVGVSELRYITYNNTPPNITAFAPASASLAIPEPQNQDFNLTYTNNENDAVLIWYINGTERQTDGNYTFNGNYSAVGVYNITAVIADSVHLVWRNWSLTVDNNNRLLSVTNIVFMVSDFLNRSNSTVNVSWAVSDADNDPITLNETRWYNGTNEIPSLRNLTSLHPNNFSKNDVWNVSIRAFDGNWSNWAHALITINNAAPDILNNNSITVRETETVNITGNATDIDSDAINFTVNDSRFMQYGNSLIWSTELTDAGTYTIALFANDSTDVGALNITLTVFDAFDSDEDGNPDFNDTDDDNDGFADSDDFLVGNLTFLNTTTLPVFNFTINGTTNFARTFNGIVPINVSNGTDTLFEFNWTFNSSNILNLANISFNKRSNGSGAVEIKGFNLPAQGFKKTAYLDDLNSTVNSVCVQDIANANFSAINSSCTGTGETLVSCNGANTGGYSCTDLGNKYKVTGLSHSAVAQLCVDNDGDRYGNGCALGSDCNDNNAAQTTSCSSGDSGSSGGGGGGGGATGGGGGGSTGSTEDRVSYYFVKLAAGEQKDLSIGKALLSVTRLQFAAAAEVISASIASKVLPEKPTSLAAPEDDVYQYFEITPTFKVTSAAIEFKVNNSWLENMDAESVALLRYVDNGYTALQTDEIDRDQNHTFFAASSPGFSVFAITAKERGTVKRAVTGNESAAAEIEVPTKEELKEHRQTGILIVAAIVIGAGVANFLLFHWKKRKIEKR